MRTRTAAVLLAAALTTVAGCSSSSHTDPAPPPATTAAAAATTPAGGGTAALTAAVRAYSAAYFKPDARAGYALLSAHCKAGISPDAYAAELDHAITTYGHQAVKTVKVDRIAGPLARVSYTYAVPVLDQSGQDWTLEGGHWRYDAC